MNESTEKNKGRFVNIRGTMINNFSARLKSSQKGDESL
jgi:hypothetical protein